MKQLINYKLYIISPLLATFLLFIFIVFVISNPKQQEEFNLLDPTTFAQEEEIDFLDPEIQRYFEEVFNFEGYLSFGEIRLIKNLYLSDEYQVEDLYGIELFLSLERLDLSGNEKISDLRRLEPLENLVELDVSRVNFEDFNYNLENVERLNISNSNISLPQLREFTTFIENQMPSLKILIANKSPFELDWIVLNYFTEYEGKELYIEHQQIDWKTILPIDIWDLIENKKEENLFINYKPSIEQGITTDENSLFPFHDQTFDADLVNHLFSAPTINDNFDEEDVRVLTIKIMHQYEFIVGGENNNIVKVFSQVPSTERAIAEAISLILWENNVKSYVEIVDDQLLIAYYVENEKNHFTVDDVLSYTQK